jgi:hypothetical protein
MSATIGHTPPMRAGAVALLLLVCQTASADDARCIDVQFTPTDKLQIVAWIETASGQYLDTLYITQQTGSFGLGNRPGRFDFNSGPMWPYGRRITTFPVWAHRHGHAFPVVLFQNDNLYQTTTPFEDPDHCFGLTGAAYQACGENALSHPFDQSSRESHFCQPLQEHEPGWDTATCATIAYTDKGRFSADPAFVTGYPPRTDLSRAMYDSPSVDMYRAMNPFDAVSQPTPVGGTAAHLPWAASMGDGDYVLWIETAKEQDFNATYSTASYPAPTGFPYATWGVPYRGQPSIVYRVPFSVAASPSEATATTYYGYGAPDGGDGTVHPADATITTDTPGSGGARLELVSAGGSMYRVRITIDPNQGGSPPAAPGSLAASAVHASDVTMAFVAPGIGAQQVAVSGYDVRIRAFDEMTAANFADSMPVTAHVTPVAPGALQTFDLEGLLPETDYWVGVRAYDDCHNPGELAISHVRTAQRTAGAVDACFVATAAYGSILANDVEMLRHVRDAILRTNALGELAVEGYYTFGPAFASVVGDSELVRASVRALLEPIVARVRRLAY